MPVSCGSRFLAQAAIGTSSCRRAKHTLKAIDPDGRETSRELSRESVEAVRSGEFVVEASTFDMQLLFAIDGRVELIVPLPADRSPDAGLTRPFALAAEGASAEISELRLWRDLYYLSSPPSGQDCATPVVTGADQIYVLGDNSVVSVDSRTWGPVSTSRVAGRPLGAK